MVSCYPFHPEFFDRLYGEWSTLDDFQRTRGVLRLVAKIVRRLWLDGDGGALIMPGSLPLDDAVVAAELTRPLPSKGWDGIIHNDIDGESSTAYRTDQQVLRFSGQSVCRRLARTIMLGSAPQSSKQGVKGIERASVLLGTVRPNENIAVFNEALNTLKGALSYLYTDSTGGRLWFDTRPTLQKLAREKAGGIAEYRIEQELKRRLAGSEAKGSSEYFSGVSVFPVPYDVPDSQEGVRLVILMESGEAGEEKAREILRCNSRVYRNMIVFVCPEAAELEDLKKNVRTYLAWKDIVGDAERITLDVAQIREAKTSMEEVSKLVDGGLKRTWCKVLVPYTEGANVDAILFVNVKINIEKGIASSAGSLLVDRLDRMIVSWAPEPFTAELDEKNLWRGGDEISVDDLWCEFCSYTNISRLKNRKVLEDAIRQAVSEGCLVLSGGILSKKPPEPPKPDPDHADKSKDPEGKPKDDTKNGRHSSSPAQEKRATEFIMTAELEPSHLVTGITKINEDIISLIAELGELHITLSVVLKAPGGIDPKLRADIDDNCKQIKNITRSIFE